MHAYTIIDEPKAGGLARLAVNPFWPLLAIMLAGAWLAWPWFALNALALGSATRRRELLLCGLGVLGSGALTLLCVLLLGQGTLSAQGMRYAGVALTGYRLAVAYAVHLPQARSFELAAYFGGAARSGLPVLIAGALVRPFAVARLEGSYLALLFV